MTRGWPRPRSRARASPRCGAIPDGKSLSLTRQRTTCTARRSNLTGIRPVRMDSMLEGMNGVSSASAPNPSKGRDPVLHGPRESVPSKPKRAPRKPSPAKAKAPDVTRTGMVWVAVIAGLVLLVLLIIFILQNQDRVSVYYLGAAGELSLGMALFIAAVAGGILVAIAGAARILQLRRQRTHPSDPPPASGTVTTERPESTPGP